MPNFHTHWVVALNAIDQAPGYVRDGWKAYAAATWALRDKVLAALAKIDGKKAAKAFEQTVRELVEKWHQNVGLHRTNPTNWYDRNKPPPTYVPERDDITCFSAYMLGACGPDFWAVLSDTGIVIPDSALDQFNLGHYNRTHRQFQASVATIGKQDSLQARVQKAYFHGMATHFAADLVVHELVNVSAGAYNLLHELWISEQATGMFEKKKSWTMHNKVEHYWDTLVRYGYLGDQADLLGGLSVASDAAGEPHGFLSRDGLLERARKLDPPPKPVAPGGRAKDEAQRKKDLEEARAELVKIIGDAAFRRMIEKPFLFPVVFADRALDPDDAVKKFVYDVVVTTAHPTADVHPVIAAERTSAQMKDGDAPGGYSERHKLEYFSSALNAKKDEACSLNYLNFTVCPSRERAARFGRGAFFDLAALRPFVDCAIGVAKRFLTELSGAYAEREAPASRPTPADLDAVVLANLGRFWNLDTGLGLVVRCVGATVPCEAVTVLDFVHVLDAPEADRLGYSRPAVKGSYLEPLGTATFVQRIAAPSPASQNAGRPELASAAPIAPFSLRPPQLFNRWREVSEPDDKQFLPRIAVGELSPRPLVRVAPQDRSRTLPGAQEIDALLYAAANTSPGECLLVPTKGLEKQECVIEISPRLTRLNLQMRVRVPRLGAAPEDVAMFLHADDDNKAEIEARMGEGSVDQYFAAEMTHWWLNRPAYGVRLVDFHPGTPDGAYESAAKTDMQRFSSTLLSNFEPKVLDKADGEKLQWKDVPDRKIKAGEWNNVVPYGKPKKNGRNYAIGTGRKSVLHPTNLDKGQVFDPRGGQLEAYTDVSPTEQVFFSLHVLVRRERDGTVWDAMTKTAVTQQDLATIRRIDAAGFVKIVLYFLLKDDGVFQLDTCHVDGVPVRVSYEQRG